MTYLKPLPKISSHNRPFWEAVKQHRFVVPRCSDCGAYNWVPYPACRTCLSENQQWTAVSGEGTIYSYTIAHRGPGAFNAEAPYGIILGKLAEGPRSMLVLANCADLPLEKLRVGLPVRIAYEDIPGEDVTMYRWTAA